MKPSVREISRITGFSPATVSNALNNKKGVNPETARRVLEAAREIGYSSTKIRQIKFVIYKHSGLVVSDTPFFAVLMESVEHTCREAGFETVIYNINAERPDYASRLNELLNDTSSGILLLATEMEPEDLRQFEQAAAPIVVLDAWFDNMAFDTVTTNNEESVRQAVEGLVEKGHRRIGYLGGSVRIQNFKQREAGWKAALLLHEIPFEKQPYYLLTPTMDGAYADMVEILKTKPTLPTAFFVDNDIIALGAMKALQEFGYSVPQDVSLIGFDDLPFSEFSSPPLSTIKFHQNEMGRLAVQRLVEKIRSGATINAKIQINTRYVERSSIRALIT